MLSNAKKSAARAVELAGKTIDTHSDQNASERKVRNLKSFEAKGQSDMKDWKWAQDPKVLFWIIGALVFLIWVVLQKP